MKLIKPGKYRHFRGGLYEVIGVAHHGETLEELVVYRSLYDSGEFPKGSLWARPKKMDATRLLSIFGRFDLLMFLQPEP